MTKQQIFILATLLLFPMYIFAATDSEIFSTFRNVIATAPNIQVPTVVEVPIETSYTFQNIAIYDNTSFKFEPNTVIRKDSFSIQPSKILINGTIVNNDLFDYNFNSATNFNIDSDTQKKVISSDSFAKEVKSDHILLSLDQYVSLPNSITIKVIKDGNEEIILSDIIPTSGNIEFPKTEAKEWTIELKYSQPLRINELEIKNYNITDSYSAVRFLAQPNHNYSIFLNPEIFLPIKTSEAGNLLNNEDVAILSKKTVGINPIFKEADSDKDGIPDLRDNCVNISNQDQKDINKNNRGDACDDFDKDGIINTKDNCPNDPNSNQIDSDSDNIGDTCDTKESRPTEQYPFAVWGMILLSAIIFSLLLFQAIKIKGRQ